MAATPSDAIDCRMVVLNDNRYSSASRIARRSAILRLGDPTIDTVRDPEGSFADVCRTS